MGEEGALAADCGWSPCTTGASHVGTDMYNPHIGLAPRIGLAVYVQSCSCMSSTIADGISRRACQDLKDVVAVVLGRQARLASFAGVKCRTVDALAPHRTIPPHSPSWLGTSPWRACGACGSVPGSGSRRSGRCGRGCMSHPCERRHAPRQLCSPRHRASADVPRQRCGGMAVPSPSETLCRTRTACFRRARPGHRPCLSI